MPGQGQQEQQMEEAYENGPHFMGTVYTKNLEIGVLQQ
jgi:hypothetical protein